MENLEKILKSLNTNSTLDKESLIDEVKKSLRLTDPACYEHWKRYMFNVNYLFYQEATLLNLSSASGCKHMAKLLTENGANVNIDDCYGISPLQAAVHDPEMVEILTKKGANVNGIRKQMTNRPLHFAAYVDCADSARILIENGAQVNVRNQLGETPLHIAARVGSVKLVQILSKSGANINVRCEYYQTPLHIAVEKNYEQVVKALIDGGAKIETRNINGETALHLAVKGGNINVVKLLVEKKAIIDAKYDSKRTCLRFAAEKKHEEIVHYLMSVKHDRLMKRKKKAAAKRSGNAIIP